MAAEGSEDFKDIDFILNKEVHNEVKGVTSQSEALKAIVDFEEEESDPNTESYKSAIRTTAVPGEETNLEELIKPETDEVVESSNQSDHLVEEEALKAASQKDALNEEDLEVYVGEEDESENSKRDSWTIISEDKVAEIDEESKLEETDKKSVERMDTDDSFEIIETEEMDTSESKGDVEEKVFEDPLQEAEKEKSEEKIEKKDSVDQEDLMEDSSEGTKEEEKTIEDKEKQSKEKVVEDKMEGFEDPLGVLSRDKDDTKQEKDSGKEETKTKEEVASEDEKEKKIKEFEVEKKESEVKEKDAAKVEKPEKTDSSKVEKGSEKPSTRWSAPEFDEMKVSELLDFSAQKSKVRLRKKGGLAATRRPDRSTWFVEDGSSSDWMFRDSTEPKPVKEVEEEEEPEPPPRRKKQPPVAAARKPPGAMASPLAGLLAGLGPRPSLRKTPADLDKKPSPKPLNKPSSEKPKPTTRVQKAAPAGAVKTSITPMKSPPGGVRLFPPTVKSPPSDSKPSDAFKPSVKPSLSQPLKPISPKTMEKKETSKPKESVTKPTPSPTKPTPAVKPSPKLKPKPQPKPRPASIAVSGIGAGSQFSFANELRLEKESKDHNSDILKEVKSPKVEEGKQSSPVSLENKNKILPPIQSSSDQSSEEKLPKWKQELLKKKKDAEASGAKPSPPPAVSKKPSPTGSTIPQWKQDLAERKRRKKEEEPSQIEEDLNKKNEVSETPKSPRDPAPIPTKEIPAWRKALLEKKKMNEKNGLKADVEKKDIEKGEELITSPKKTGRISPPPSKGSTPQWQLELTSRKSKLAQFFSRRDMEEND